MPISERWRSMTVAALPTPIRSDGQLHDDAFGHLVHSIGGTAVGGIAVGTPLGRGTRLSADQWKLVLVTGRERLPLGKTYLASVGAPPSARHPREVFNAACLMAATAASSGVDLLIAEPPVAVRGRAERDRLILEYHAAIAETGLPLLISLIHPKSWPSFWLAPRFLGFRSRRSTESPSFSRSRLSLANSRPRNWSSRVKSDFSATVSSRVPRA